VAQTLQHLQHAANPEVRHLAAVLLRKWVTRHWTKLAPEVRGPVEQQQQEEEAAAASIAVLGSHSTCRRQWNQHVHAHALHAFACHGCLNKHT
jgi:hypothetical protein